MNLTCLNSAELSNILTSRNMRSGQQSFRKEATASESPLFKAAFYSNMNFLSLKDYPLPGSRSAVGQGWALAEGPPSSRIKPTPNWGIGGTMELLSSKRKRVLSHTPRLLLYTLTVW